MAYRRKENWVSISGTANTGSAWLVGYTGPAASPTPTPIDLAANLPLTTENNLLPLILFANQVVGALENARVVEALQHELDARARAEQAPLTEHAEKLAAAREYQACLHKPIKLSRVPALLAEALGHQFPHHDGEVGHQHHHDDGGEQAAALGGETPLLQPEGEGLGQQ